MKDIRKYNQANAFTTMGAVDQNLANERNGTYKFRINGELYHRIGNTFFLFNNKIPLETFVTIFLLGSMLPEGSELPKLGYGQIRLKKKRERAQYNYCVNIHLF